MERKVILGILGVLEDTDRKETEGTLGTADDFLD